MTVVESFTVNWVCQGHCQLVSCLECVISTVSVNKALSL